MAAQKYTELDLSECVGDYEFSMVLEVHFNGRFYPALINQR